MNKENVYYYVLYNEISKSLNKVTEKLNAAMAENSSEEKIKELIDMENILDSMSGILFVTYHYINNNFYYVSRTLKGDLNKLCEYISDEEVNKIEEAINSDIVKKNYYDKIEGLKEKEKELMELAEKGSLTDKELVINEGLEDVESIKVDLKTAIEKMIKIELESLEEFLDIDKGTVKLEVQDDFISSDVTNSIIYGENKELDKNLKIKDSSSKILEQCQVIIGQIKMEEENKEIEFVKLKKSINELLEQTEKALKKSDKYINKLVMGIQNIDDNNEEDKKEEELENKKKEKEKKRREEEKLRKEKELKKKIREEEEKKKKIENEGIIKKENKKKEIENFRKKISFDYDRTVTDLKKIEEEFITNTIDLSMIRKKVNERIESENRKKENKSRKRKKNRHNKRKK